MCIEANNRSVNHLLKSKSEGQLPNLKNLVMFDVPESERINESLIFECENAGLTVYWFDHAIR